jgi:DNA-binding transcriptional regulator YiaG
MGRIARQAKQTIVTITRVRNTVSVMPPKPSHPAMSPTKLRKIMRDKGIGTQRELAKKIGVDKQTVWRWLHKRTPISERNAALIKTKLKLK